MTRRSRTGSLLPRLVFLLAVTGLVLNAGTVPHVHVGPEPGLWNHDHDLTLLATRSGTALLPDLPAVPPASTVEARGPHIDSTPLPAPVRRHGDPRAPPLA